MEANTASPLCPGLGGGASQDLIPATANGQVLPVTDPARSKSGEQDPLVSTVLPRAGSTEVAILGDDTKAPPCSLLHWHLLGLPPQSTESLVLGSASRELNRRQPSIGF